MRRDAGVTEKYAASAIILSTTLIKRYE